MPIKIVKKAALTQDVEPAPLVEDSLVPGQATTQAETLAWWQNEAVPPGAKAKQCVYCKQWYLKPCDADRHPVCGNYLHLKSMGKA